MADTFINFIDSYNPFSQENLNRIFKVKGNNYSRITSRENSRLEFKKSFNLLSVFDYAKTMAAYANTKGGFIVFGVEDNPRIPVGLKNKKFENLDAKDVTNKLNSVFSPEIKWDHSIHEFNNKKFGLIFTYESENKPVMAIKNTSEIKEGAIYYRYNAISKIVKYPELKSIIEERRNREQRLWMKFVMKAAKIGIENAAIFSLETGKGDTPGKKFIIDESILSKLEFIKHGEFNEKEGSPAIRIIGEATSSNYIISKSKKEIVKTKGIRLPDIIEDFLDQKKVLEPIDYITQICCEATAFLPVYYYIYLSKKPLVEIIKFIEKTKTREKSKEKLLERLKTNRSFFIEMKVVDSIANKMKRKYQSEIVQNKINIPKDHNNIKYFLQSIQSLKANEIQYKILFPVIKKIYNDLYFTKKSNVDIASHIRHVLCHVDKTLFFNKIKRN